MFVINSLSSMRYCRDISSTALSGYFSVNYYPEKEGERRNLVEKRGRKRAGNE